MNPVCVKCRVEMRPSCVGVALVGMATDGPHELRMADAYHCCECGVEIIARCAERPIVGFPGEELTAALKQMESDLGRRTVRFWVNARERELYLQEYADERANR